MRDSPRMSGGQSVSDPGSDSGDLIKWHGSPATKSFFQRFARDELHHDVGNAVCFVDGVNRDHVVMDDTGSRSGFACESLDNTSVDGNARLQKLDGHIAAEFRIVAAIDDSHSASANGLRDLVLSQPAERIRVIRRHTDVSNEIVNHDTRRNFRSAGQATMGSGGRYPLRGKRFDGVLVT